MVSQIEYVSLDNWRGRWRTPGATTWHINHVDTHLQKYTDLFTNGETGLSIFVPLCGKSLDLKWLADKGYKVFGVEICDQPVSEIFTDAGLSAKVISVGSNSTLYEACDGRLRVLLGDLFSLQSDICGQFDCIWDKNSFGSINPADRERYTDLVCSLLKPQGRILMCTYVYDQSEKNTVPFSMSTDLLKSYYGDRFDIELLESIKFEEKRQLFKLSHLNQLFHFLKKLN